MHVNTLSDLFDSDSPCVFDTWTTVRETDVGYGKVLKNKEHEKDKVWVYLSDIRQLQDVREDVEAWGLQQRADSLGQCWAWQRQELLHLHLMPGDTGDTVG